MKIKHLQLNTSLMKYPEKIVDFINKYDFDTVCLQEVYYPIGEENKVADLLQKKKYFYEEGLHFKYLVNEHNLAVGIVSKFPVLDVVRVYWNGKNYDAKEIDHEDFLGQEVIVDDMKTDEFPASRGIKHVTKSRCILMCLLDTPQGIIRVITTHFTVSDLCTEILQMYDIASLVTSLIKNSKDYPTIFSGDLNIRAQSYSVTKLREVLTCHTLELKDTLSKDHVAKQKDFPEGLAIDHVFSKGLKLKKVNTEEVDFSVHKAVIAEFEKR